MTHARICLLCLILTVVHAAGQCADKPVLRILNWSEDYIEVDETLDKSLPLAERSPTLMAFSRQYGCDIAYDEYDSEDELFKMIHNLRQYYDVIGITSDMVGKLKAAGRLMKLSPEMIPNRRYIQPKYLSLPADPKGVYFMPYLIGTTGLIYRRDLVGHDVDSWQDYFMPGSALKGKLACLNTHYMIFFGLQYLGLDTRNTDRNLIRKAARLFFDLKTDGYLAFISSDIEKTGDKLASGELAMAICYSGEALAMVADDPDRQLRYVIPKEGAEYFMDCLAVLDDAPNKVLAQQFINFFHEPEINARNAIFLNYSTANTKALEMIKRLSPAYFNNPNINIPEETRARLAIFTNPTDDLRVFWQKISN